jgi:hypothetical protein
MPIDVGEIPDTLKRAARCGNLVPFIGAGISRHAKSQVKYPFPSWTELISDLGTVALNHKNISLRDKEEIDGLVRQGKFLMAAQELEAAVQEEYFIDFMRVRFGDTTAEPGLIHNLIFDLKPSLIVTTNYDRLLETAFFRKFNVPAEISTYKDAHEVERFIKKHERWVDKPLIFKIHGTVEKPAEVVFGEKSYRALRYHSPGYRAVLSAIFTTRVVLMLGFSFSDPEISAMMETLRESLEHRASIDYIVLPRGAKGEVEKRRLKEDFGLITIEYDETPSGDHSELIQFIKDLAGFVPLHARGQSTSA